MNLIYNLATVYINIGDGLVQNFTTKPIMNTNIWRRTKLFDLELDQTQISGLRTS